MAYWKIELMEKHLEVVKEESLRERETITLGYIDHIEVRLRLMKEAFDEGVKSVNETVGGQG